MEENTMPYNNFIDFIKPVDGRTVRDHQPKAPVRDAVSR
jgi:hypothetical protein